ncbi:hypothetical protein PV682_03780 [Streptomyces niveiscabiei]|uniref:hypothetical protein n=1 Tax=Streptomyces niveiscabiei TaxID=164115 RepID=UPI0029B649DB|nr:hypothetical protein [Streptomyces niveiscabiei]MDX3380567.1 hypothetical protein [Streptomyces niveiscabiei]
MRFFEWRRTVVRSGAGRVQVRGSEVMPACWYVAVMASPRTARSSGVNDVSRRTATTVCSFVPVTAWGRAGRALGCGAGWGLLLGESPQGVR